MVAMEQTELVQVNIRCVGSTADALKALAASQRATLGETLQLLLSSYQPDSALLPADSDAIADLRSTVADLESRLTALESRLCAPAPAPALSERDAMIMALHGQGISKTEIQRKLFDAGWKTDTGNHLSRDTISRVLKLTQETHNDR